MKPWSLPVLTGLLLVVCGCTPSPFNAANEDFASGKLDLRTRNFSVQGAVVPQGWLWDQDALWSPINGRPEGLPPAQALGPPDRGGSFSLGRADGNPRALLQATAWMTALVPSEDFALQIGAFPGAVRVWVNGIVVWQSGSFSEDGTSFREEGSGTMVTVQPIDGRLDLVVEMVSDDPMVRHSEINRLWILGPATPMMQSDRSERNWRSLQATILGMGLLAFLWISRFRKEHRALMVFAAFLAVCLLKLLVNVEQPEPFLAPVFPWIPLSVYLFLNHGFNLLPFPLFVFFLHRQFPEDVSFRAFGVIGAITLVATLWELFPFVALTLGWGSVYGFVMGHGWSFVLNLSVVLSTLYIFERFYHLYTRKRPLAGALFYGGIFLGLIILIPIPLSFFMPVKHTYFLSWGLFIDLLILGVDLIRLQIQKMQNQLHELNERLESYRIMERFCSKDWASWLGKDSLLSLKAGDQRRTEAVFVQIHSSTEPESWLPLVGNSASIRQAVLVDWRHGTGTWAIGAWSETALAFALDVQRKLQDSSLEELRIVLTLSTVEFRVLDMDPLWLPTVSQLPFPRLAELMDHAKKFGASVVLDENLKDGLVIGGWRRHRHLTVAGTEIELYEAEEESLALLKDKTMDSFEAGLAHARAGRMEEAIQSLFSVVRQNPFDQAAKSLLTAWGTTPTP